MVLVSLIMTQVIVVGMELLLLGQVSSDYLLTGLVASVVVASLVVGVILGFADKTQQLAGSLLASEDKLRRLFDLSPLGIALCDMQGRFIEFNQAFQRICGYSVAEIKAMDYWALTPQEYAELEAEQLDCLEQTGSYGPYEKEYVHKLGHRVPLRLNGVLITGQDGQKYIWSIVEDMSEQKQKDQLIWSQANLDSLTKLPNRRLLMDRIGQAMAATTRSGRHCALLQLDLDHFKRVNDILGHSSGDLLLLDVAQRLQACVREGDSVARLGGDEFAVVLMDLDSRPDEAAIQAEQHAEKIRSQLSQPFWLHGSDYHLTPSIGIVVFRGHGESLEGLLIHADAAMYQAKAMGRNAIAFFDPALQAVMEAHGELEKALRHGLARNEFQLYYQLQVDAQGKPIGSEALLRWNHPQRGLVSPAEFIPVAEESGIILPMGKWVLQEACAQLGRWAATPGLSTLQVAVNVSARQFREGNFVHQVKEVLEKSGVAAGKLKLELTESMILDDVEDSIRKMEELHQLGLSLSLDDFGTGYSSLTYLKRLPFDQIKIDQSFVRDITTDQNDAAIVKTIIAMAQSLHLEVIAEGVETEAQREFLEKHGCRAFQGYLYSKPLPVADLERHLAG